MLTKQQTPASPNASISRPGITTLAEVLPGEEVLQRPGLVLLLTDDAVSLLLLHLPNARREGVDVVEHGLHGDGDFVRLLTRGGKKIIVFLISRTESRIQRVVNLPAFVKPFSSDYVKV